VWRVTYCRGDVLITPDTSNQNGSRGKHCRQPTCVFNSDTVQDSDSQLLVHALLSSRDDEECMHECACHLRDLIAHLTAVAAVGRNSCKRRRRRGS